MVFAGGGIEENIPIRFFQWSNAFTICFRWSHLFVSQMLQRPFEIVFATLARPKTPKYDKYFELFTSLNLLESHSLNFYFGGCFY